MSYNKGKVTDQDMIKLVQIAQTVLGLQVDGMFGPNTSTKVRNASLDKLSQLNKAEEVTTKVGVFHVKSLQGDLFEVSLKEGE